MIVEWQDQISHADSSEVVLDRAALFGDGFFTTGIINCGQLELRKEHLERIKNSAERLLFTNIPIASIAELIDEACIKQPNSVIRLNISRQQSQRGYSIDASAEIKVQIILNSMPTAPLAHCKLIDSGVAASINPSLAGIKHLNRLDSVLAASQLPDTQFEALMYAQEQLVCGSKSNVFVYLDGVWQTPELTNAGVAGIMRQTVLERMHNHNQQVKITKIGRKQLQNISAAFVTNCVVGILPVSHINGIEICIDSVSKLKHQLSL